MTIKTMRGKAAFAFALLASVSSAATRPSDARHAGGGGVALHSGTAPHSGGGTLVEYPYYGDYQMWKHIYKSSGPFIIPNTQTPAIIIPHHDITTRWQNAFYKALSQQNKDCSVVVLISPDHFEAGGNLITIPHKTSFDTPEGTLELYEPLAKELSRQKCPVSKYTSRMSSAWKTEHGIFDHTPFIKHYFPNAKFFPILLKPDSADGEAAVYKMLASVLDRLLPPDALAMASVDFSHYQIPSVTALHDYVSMNTIANGEDLTHIEVDSPETLTAVTAFAALRGYQKSVLIHRTSTYDLIREDNIASTSHQYWTFCKAQDASIIKDYEERAKASGAQRINTADYENTKNQTILLCGSGKTGAGIRTYWKWDRYKTSKNKADINLREAAGVEARFFNGFDALIFELPTGQTYFQSKHKTNLFACAVSSAQYLDALEAGTADGAPQNQINIAIVNCGGETPEAFLKRTACAEALLQKYEVVIARDPLSNGDAFALLAGGADGAATQADGKGASYTKYNLGVIADENGRHVAGALLCINWSGGTRSVLALPYENDGAYPAAIFQNDVP